MEVQIGWAKSYGLPIILHTREATDLVIDLIGKNNEDSLTGVFHCWDGNFDQAKKVMDFGFALHVLMNSMFTVHANE